MRLGRRPKLRRGTRLGEVLVLVHEQRRFDADSLKASAAVGEVPVDLEAGAVSWQVPGRLLARRRHLVVLRLQPDLAGVPTVGGLQLASSRGALRLTAAEIDAAATDLTSLLREELVHLDAASRGRIHRLVLETAAPALERPGAFTLSKGLRQVRNALREPLPEALMRQEEGEIVNVDAIMAVDERSFWIAGWARDEDGNFGRITAVSPEGQRVDFDDAFRIPRPDVDEVYAGSGLPQGQRHGFMKFFSLPAPSPLDEGWIVELTNAGGAGVEVDAPAVIRTPGTVKDALMAEFLIPHPNREALRVHHLNPALERFQAEQRKSEAIESIAEYGPQVDEPTTSVLVTLHQRIDFLGHQLLAFAQDEAMRDVELLYVLDLPERAAALADYASAMYALHGVPFKVITLNRNAGFPNANNLGASVARGRLLLLLNSDVLPDRPGWVDAMARFYDTTPNIGALAPKLLFEDDSLQHAGMYFERDAASGTWTNQHYFKGLHRTFPPANVTRPVPAVTGACLLIETALFHELGGFRDIYIRGGYEDSDLCLRLVERGRQNWYQSEVELYHLEAQSLGISDTARPRACWLQTRLFGDLIESLMREDDTQPAPAPARVAAEEIPVASTAGPPPGPAPVSTSAGSGRSSP